MDYEHSELLLYQNMVVQESGDIEGALKHLDRYEHHIFDRLAVEETYGELHLKLKNQQAVNYFSSLIKRNPENTRLVIFFASGGFNVLKMIEGYHLSRKNCLPII